MSRQHVAMVWYRREQWVLLRALTDDRDAVENTFEEWLANARKVVRELAARDVEVYKVDADVNEMYAWCQARDRPFDSGARSQWVVEKANQASGQ